MASKLWLLDCLPDEGSCLLCDAETPQFSSLTAFFDALLVDYLTGLTVCFKSLSAELIERDDFFDCCFGVGEFVSIAPKGWR